MIIAIDGPAGSGKSTTARAVSRRLGYLYLDTGAMYRVVALHLLRNGFGPESDLVEEDIRRQLDGLDLEVSYGGATGMRVSLAGEDVTEAVRSQDVGAFASQTSARPEVREWMLERQRTIARAMAEEVSGVVVEGRDIGTVVLPEAELKVFMTADSSVRAERRRKQLLERAVQVPYENVLSEIERRDRDDSDRSLAPLAAADDAVTLDTSRMPFADQVEFIVDAARRTAANETNVSSSK